MSMDEYVLRPLQIILDDDFFLYRLQCLEWVLIPTHPYSTSPE
jgi:hypothetical protein